MGMYIDHWQISSRNLYVSAHKLREETGLGFYDGGFLSPVIANKIFPLGGGAYIEINGVVDAGAVSDPKTPGAKAYMDRTVKGDCFSLIAMRVDTLAELEQIAKRHRSTVSQGGRTRPDGPPVKWFSTPAGAAPAGRVNWYCHEDRQYMHPSGQPAISAPGLVTPRGVAWLEMGGTEKEMDEWIGQPSAPFGYRFNGKAHGLYAIAVKTDKGEVVIRRRPLLDN